MSNKRRYESNVGTVAVEGYDYMVASRMTGRAGSSTVSGGKGIAFEIMYEDKKNLQNAFKSKSLITKLAKSSTATQVDLVTMEGAKVVERIQCKDTPSISGTAKTINQIQNGKYAGAQVVGTTESAYAYNTKAASKGISKVMKDSGISTADTSRISNKYNGVVSTTGIMNAVGNASKTGGVVGGGVNLAKSIIDGDDFCETTKSVTSGILNGAASNAAGTFAAETAMMVIKNAPLPPTAKFAIVLGTGMFTGNTVSEGIEDICDDIGQAVSNIASEIGGFFDAFFC